MRRIEKYFPLLTLLALTAAALPAQNYSIVERTDLRRYENGRYVGLTSREVKSYISLSDTQQKDSGAVLYNGEFFVNQETKRAKRVVRDGIQDSIPAVFTIDTDASLSMITDNGFPSFRNYPALPRQKLNTGDSWTAEAVRAVDPCEKSLFTHIPLLIEYRYIRDDTWNGNDVYVLSASWASRYGLSDIDPEGDPELKSAYGSHRATLYVSRKTGAMLLSKDTVDETFVYESGLTVSFKGTISLFTEYSPPKNPEPPLLVEPVEGVEVKRTNAGTVLVLKNLQFEPDLAVLLPGQDSTLESIAASLKKYLETNPDGHFLVTGHTASTGDPKGEAELSIKRARTIARELVERGVPNQNLLCKGMGGTVPVADNSSPEGKARNRRVEITVLE